MGFLSILDIMKRLPRRYQVGDPRSVERVVTFIKLCNESRKEVIKMVEIFKKCSYCGKEWYSLREFVIDEEVWYLGKTEHVDKVLFFFNHKPCKTTISLGAGGLDKYFEITNILYGKKRD